MYTLLTHTGEVDFETMEELKEHIEAVHAEEGGWDWIVDITDDEGNGYACEWTLNIVKQG